MCELCGAVSVSEWRLGCSLDVLRVCMNVMQSYEVPCGTHMLASPLVSHTHTLESMEMTCYDLLKTKHFSLVLQRDGEASAGEEAWWEGGSCATCSKVLAVCATVLRVVHGEVSLGEQNCCLCDAL